MSSRFHRIKHQFIAKVQRFFLLFLWFFTRLEKKVITKMSRTLFQFWEMTIEITVTQTEKKLLNSVKYLSSLEEWVRFFSVGKVIRNSTSMGSAIKWSSQNIYHRGPPLIIKSTCAKWKKGILLKQIGAELIITSWWSHCFCKTVLAESGF